MASPQCPVCYGPLEVRDVTPGFICGGWPETATQLDPAFREWRLPEGRTLVLCGACELEEFMVPGGWGERLGLGDGRLPIDDLTPIPERCAIVAEQDKFCPHCNLRLAFLNVIAAEERI